MGGYFDSVDLIATSFSDTCLLSTGIHNTVCVHPPSSPDKAIVHKLEAHPSYSCNYSCQDSAHKSFLHGICPEHRNWCISLSEGREGATVLSKVAKSF